MPATSHNLGHYFYTAFYILVKSIAGSIIWAIIGIIGLIILRSKVPFWDIAVGLPMLLVGGGFVVNSLSSAILAFFYPPYNLGVCTLCTN